MNNTESNKKINSLQVKIENFEEEKKILENELEQSKSYCASYTLQLKQGSEYVNELKSENNEKQSEIDLLNKEIEIIKVKNEAIIKILKDESMQHIKNISDLTDGIKEMESDNKESENELRIASKSVNDLKNELDLTKKDLIDSKNKIEKLEKNNLNNSNNSINSNNSNNNNNNNRNKNGGQMSRPTGGYDANVDRISDLEDELESLKSILQKSNDENFDNVRNKEEEINYYKEQSEQYLKKLQEVRLLFSYIWYYLFLFLLN